MAQAYAQIIIAYVFTDMPMIDKKSLGSDDLIYNSVEYIAKNFRNEISLEKWHSIWELVNMYCQECLPKPFIVILINM